MDVKEDGIQVEKIDDATKRTRLTSRPPLSKNLIAHMIDFLIQEERRPIPDITPVWTRSWLELLTEDTEIKLYAKGLSLKQRFLNWLRVLDVLTLDDGTHKLCLAGSKKVVPCKEEFQKIIRDAHRSTGEFEMSGADKLPVASLQHGRPRKHNSVDKCIKMIKAKYAFGNREFGMRKTAVYREVLRCPDCHHEVKARLLGKDFPEEVEMIDPDFGNEMNSIMLADAPFCMPLKGPSKNSVWYNQSGLAVEDVFYKKLLGVIEEVGIEIGRTVQNDQSAVDRLTTKICCAEKLIQDLKKSSEKQFAFRIPSSHFMQDYDKLMEEYLTQGDTALYLQDMNYLVNVYKRFRNTEFIDRINKGLNELEKDRSSSMKLVMKGNDVILQGSANVSQQSESAIKGVGDCTITKENERDYHSECTVADTNLDCELVTDKIEHGKTNVIANADKMETKSV